MRITLVRSGGFAGLHETRSLDTASLPEAEREAVEELVGRTRFFDLPAAMPDVGRQRDRQVVSLTVEHEGRSHTVHCREDAVPAELAPLVERLRKQPRSSRS